jgi:hypothetical protein
MNASDVAERVSAIHKMAIHDEAAHAAEDNLYRDVLRAIAQGECDNPAACAQQALMTQAITFGRWYSPIELRRIGAYCGVGRNGFETGCFGDRETAAAFLDDFGWRTPKRADQISG